MGGGSSTNGNLLTTDSFLSTCGIISSSCPIANLTSTTNSIRGGRCSSSSGTINRCCTTSAIFSTCNNSKTVGGTIGRSKGSSTSTCSTCIVKSSSRDNKTWGSTIYFFTGTSGNSGNT